MNSCEVKQQSELVEKLICFISEEWVEPVSFGQTVPYCNFNYSHMHYSLHKVPAKLRIVRFGKDR